MVLNISIWKCKELIWKQVSLLNGVNKNKMCVYLSMTLQVFKSLVFIVALQPETLIAITTLVNMCIYVSLYFLHCCRIDFYLVQSIIMPTLWILWPLVTLLLMLFTGTMWWGKIKHHSRPKGWRVSCIGIYCALPNVCLLANQNTCPYSSYVTVSNLS